MTVRLRLLTCLLMIGLPAWAVVDWVTLPAIHFEQLFQARIFCTLALSPLIPLSYLIHFKRERMKLALGYLMAVMMLFLLVVGTAMDLTPTILIFGPVCAPLAVKAGIDPVYFGFMFIYVGCIGLITPPVGTVLNVVSSIARVNLDTVIKGMLPFLLAETLLMFLLVLFPALVIVPARWFY